MCTAEVLGGSPEGLSLWQRTDLRTVWDPQKAGWIHALGMADAQGSQLLFFLPRAVDEAIPEAMRGRVLSWNVQRGEEGRVLFFLAAGCGSHSKMGQRLLLLLDHTVGVALLLARRRSQLWSLALGGAGCMCIPSLRRAATPLRFSESGCANAEEWLA